jgi:hypothetical protein
LRFAPSGLRIWWRDLIGKVRTCGALARLTTGSSFTCPPTSARFSDLPHKARPQTSGRQAPVLERLVIPEAS